ANGAHWTLELVGSTIRATRSTINAVSTAASVAIGGGMVGVALSGAGASAVNAITSTAKATITGATLSLATGSVLVDAQSNARINASVMATALSAGFGQVGVGISIGAAISRNFIGFDAQGDVVANRGTTIATVENSIITASQGGLIVNAASGQSIQALVIAGAGAVAAGQVGVALSGAGVEAENRIGSTTTAQILGSTTNINATLVDVLAADTSVIEALAGAVALSVAAGMVGVSGAIAASIAVNSISSATSAIVSRNALSGGLGSVRATSGAIRVLADDDSTIKATAASVALAAGFGVGGIAVSGAGAESQNVITTTTQVVVDTMRLEPTTGITLAASGAAVIEARVISAAASMGVGAVGVGISVGASLAH
ncbi:MAG: hypothetical protein Q8L76_14450, partial [Cypionkella sp.]|nr:hypothetical protein [Cypionkella sp.]